MESGQRVRPQKFQSYALRDYCLSHAAYACSNLIHNPESAEMNSILSKFTELSEVKIIVWPVESFIQHAPLKQRIRKTGRATDLQITVYRDSAVSSQSQWGRSAGSDHERGFLSLFSWLSSTPDLIGARCRSCQFSFALIKTVGMLKMLTADSFSLQTCWKGVMTMNESIMWDTL